VEKEVSSLVECLVIDTIGVIYAYIGLELGEQRKHNDKRKRHDTSKHDERIEHCLDEEGQ